MEDKDPILALASPVRGEARYLLEWIAYHRALGVRAFFLGDNGGDDGTSDVLADLHQRKIVFCFDWRGQTHFQLQFIAQAIQAARLFADGLFLLDVDEFLRWDVLRVDHFLLKSREEFAAKRARGMGLLSPERDWDRYFELNDRNEVEDPISSELVERTKAEMAKIAAQIALPAGVIPAASPASQ
jgi:Glycosyl transferase family 2